MIDKRYTLESWNLMSVCFLNSSYAILAHEHNDLNSNIYTA